MRFRQFDSLRTFTVVAACGGFAAAAERLNLTKGAVSYQIRQLEEALGFALFTRLPRGVALTPRGKVLQAAAGRAFDGLEAEIRRLQAADTPTLVIGVTSYFAARWLSPRLTDFMAAHPGLRLRLQPVVNTMDLAHEGVDLAVRWGNGRWRDVPCQRLFACPAFPTGNAAAAARIAREGAAAGFAGLTLLRDRDDSNAWSDWFRRAGLGVPGDADTLIIPDPNVRVQAVIDGQGIALNDALVGEELASGRLHRLSEVALEDYGYHLAYAAETARRPEIREFIDWMVAMAGP